MLALNRTQASSTATKKLTPNLLPCSIKHSGPVDGGKRYWAPTKPADEGSTVYFRGRKLRGRAVKVPKGYRGAALLKTDELLPVKRDVPRAEELRRMEEERYEEEEEMDVEEEVPVKLLEEVAAFDEIVVWGHEALPEDDDEYVRGVEEWVAFAEAMHVDESAPALSAEA